MKKLTLGIVLLSLFVIPQTVLAGCSCMCVNNNKAWVCSNSWDVPAGYCGGWCTSKQEIQPNISPPTKSLFKTSYLTSKKRGSVVSDIKK